MVAITVATNVTVRTGAQGIPGIPGTAAPHAVDHEAGGDDEVTIEDLVTGGTIGQVPTATASGTMVMATPATFGNVSSPGSETSGNLAEFTGDSAIAETSLTTAAVSGHLVDVANPHAVTAAQAGAEPAGAIATHAALPNAHHAEVHTILSHDTDTTGAELTSLADGSDVDSLHIHAIADAHIADATAHTGLLDLAGTRLMTGDLDTGGNDIIGAIPLGGTLSDIGLADYLDEVGSVGFFGDPAGLIVANGINFDVATGLGAFHTTAAAASPLGIGDWPASATNTIPLNSVRYVGVEWNSATPQVVVKTTNVWTLIQEWPLGTVTRDSDGVHATPVPIRLSNFASLMDQRISETEPFARSNGLNLGNSLLTVQRTAGRGWMVTTPQDFALFDSNASDNFDRYFQDSGSGFNVQLNQTSFEDQSFEDGSGTLATLTNNRFGVRWWYIDLQDGSLSMMYGTSNTNDIAVALLEEPPSDLPPRLQVGNILLGRYVFVKSGGVAIDVSDIWGTSFSAGGGGDGDVSGPAGGVVATELPVFADTTGKAIGGSGILSTDVELTANKGASSGYASLDASQIVVEPAQVLRTTTGPTSLTIGAVADGQTLVRSGSTIIGSTPAGGGDVVGPAGGVVDGEIALYDSTTGKLIKGSSTVLGDLVADADLIDSSAGVGDAGKPIKLDSAGVLDSTIAEPPGSIATHAALPNAHHDELHAATHSDGGTDEIVIADLASTGIDGAVAMADGAGGLSMSNSMIQNSKTGLVDVLTNLITINAGDPAKVDIRASQGVVVNFDPDPTDPTMVDLVWAVPFEAITLPNLASAIATSVFVVDGGGGTPVIELTNAFPTPEELRTKLFVGAAIHSGVSIVDAVVSGGVSGFDTGSSLDDLFAAIGDLSLSGNLYSPNAGGNLLLDKSSGVAFGRGLNPSNINNQHNLNTSLQTAIGFYSYSRQDGASGFTASNEVTIDPDNYDDGSGTLASTTNKYTIQRLIFSPRAGGLTAIEYGQNLYNSLNDAIDGITENGIVKNPTFSQSILRGWLIVQGGTTDLTDTADAAFRENINEIAQPSGAGNDVDAIHVNGANEISSITAKTTVVAGDLLVIEDSAAGNIKKSVPFSSLDARYAELAGATFTGDVVLNGATPTLEFSDTDGDVDERRFEWVTQSGGFKLLSRNDIGTSTEVMKIDGFGASGSSTIRFFKLLNLNDNAIINCKSIELEGSTTDPFVDWRDDNNDLDEKRWRMEMVDGDWMMYTRTDASSAIVTKAIEFVRTGTDVAVNLGGPLTVDGEATADEPTLSTSLTTRGFVEALVQGVEWLPSVISDTLATPPVHVEGARYIIPAGATGDWSANVDDITQSVSSVWVFITPTEGTTVAVDNIGRSRRFASSVWISLGSTIDHSNTIGLTTGDAGHTQLQLRSEKGSASGYVGLTAGAKITSGAFQVYGTIADTACEGDDSRLSDSRAPNGTAAGSLTGTYPNPGVADGADSTAIHDNTSGEILAITLKAAPGGTDVLVIEDVAAANVKKRTTAAAIAASGPPAAHALGGSEHSSSTIAQVNALVSDGNFDADTASRPPSGTAGGDLGGTYPNPTVDDGADGTAIHDNVNSEISALTDKAVPVGGDFLLIEDSAASNAKKRINISNLPASTPVFGSEYVSITTTSTTQNNTSTYVSHLRLPASGTITFPSGLYRLEIQYVWEDNAGHNSRVEEDGVLVGAEHTTSSTEGDDIIELRLENRTLNGAHDFELLVKSSTGPARLKTSTLTVWRIS